MTSLLDGFGRILLSFAHILTHNSRYFFERIIIDIIVYGRKGRCVLFLKRI